MYDTLLKGARIINPGGNFDGVADLAIQDDRVAALETNIPNSEARLVFDLSGKILSPGLIDIHCHPSGIFMHAGLPSDKIGLNTGVTMLCDAGSAGAANFQAFRHFIVEPARISICCFLNLCMTGLVTLPEIWTNDTIKPEDCKPVVEANRDIIKGIKVRAVQAMAENVGMKGMEAAKKLAVDLNLPLMVHLGEKRERVSNDTLDRFSRDALTLLDKGDILSHYLTGQAGGVILPDGTVYPELESARDRGVVLDTSNGLFHFSFDVARHAFAQGLVPTTISSDLAATNHTGLQSLAVVMSVFLNLGLSLEQVIRMTTINPALALGEEKFRGHLRPGVPANLTIMELVEGDFLFMALTEGQNVQTLRGQTLLEPRMVFHAGEMLPACSGYHIPFHSTTK